MNETTNDNITPEAVVSFWRQAGSEQWFRKDASFDASFHERFRDAHFSAARREYDSWNDTAKGSLALLLLLDQFPRNCFRGTGHMYATDPLARLFADSAIAQGHDKMMEADLRVFFYLPFSHSEDMEHQDRACLLNDTLGGSSLEHALGHRDIVRRFGRFPHRNFILGRKSTLQEQAFLEAGGFKG